jgi:regulator of protease activity HflC (stomatin/prohibitin superfamily)
MGAEDYFAGGRTQFNIDFEDQLNSGLFLVKRREVVQQAPQNSGPASANASLEENQTQFGDDDKVVFVVEKILDGSGVPVRKTQSFAELGITVVESRITDVVPNAKFNERMQLKQQASADRAVAREQRIQEEEQKLLAEARGEREVAERKAATLVTQIEATTQAETEKQLAITEANKLKESAEIDRQRSEILLAKARIDAEAVQVAADAEAYQKREILSADNALAQKLDAWVKINEAYADALAKRAVPATTFGGAGGEGYAQGSDVKAFLDIMTVNAAKQLDVDPTVAK